MRGYRRRNNGKRGSRGSQIAQLGPTLWLVFTIFLFPLTSLATIGIQYTFLLNAAHLAASAASEANSFSANVSPTQLSATNIAQQVATQSAAGFSGVNLQSTTTYIVICPLNAGGTVTRQTTPLTAPADSSQNSYDVEVVLTGQVQPLISNPQAFLGNVPGLSAPIVFSARSDVAFENTQGLNQ